MLHGLLVPPLLLTFLGVLGFQCTQLRIHRRQEIDIAISRRLRKLQLLNRGGQRTLEIIDLRL